MLERKAGGGGGGKRGCWFVLLCSLLIFCCEEGTGMQVQTGAGQTDAWRRTVRAGKVLERGKGKEKKKRKEKKEVSTTTTKIFVAEGKNASSVSSRRFLIYRFVKTKQNKTRLFLRATHVHDTLTLTCPISLNYISCGRCDSISKRKLAACSKGSSFILQIHHHTPSYTIVKRN